MSLILTSDRLADTTQKHNAANAAAFAAIEEGITNEERKARIAAARQAAWDLAGSVNELTLALKQTSANLWLVIYISERKLQR